MDKPFVCKTHQKVDCRETWLCRVTRFEYLQKRLENTIREQLREQRQTIW